MDNGDNSVSSATSRPPSTADTGSDRKPSMDSTASSNSDRGSRTATVLENMSPRLVRQPKPTDFEIIRTIGKGAFGKVLLVRHKRNGQLYAMKVMSKDHIIDKNHVRYTHSEREIMAKLTHPYLVELRFAFHTEDRLYLVMDYMSGGELFTHLRKLGILQEDRAKVYVAEMVLALEYLHSLNIIHRDLKPENILLDDEGHICLTDYGLAKKDVEDNGSTKTLCGTNEYMAPEMILRAGYGKPADWWSLGAVMFEMLCGHPPFQAKDEKALYKKILTSKDCRDLLQKLLERNVEKRLGGTRSSMFEVGGVEALKKHPYFKSIDWEALERREISAPIAIHLSDATDTSYFDPAFTGMARNFDPTEEPIEITTKKKKNKGKKKKKGNNNGSPKPPKQQQVEEVKSPDSASPGTPDIVPTLSEKLKVDIHDYEALFAEFAFVHPEEAHTYTQLSPSSTMSPSPIPVSPVNIPGPAPDTEESQAVAGDPVVSPVRVPPSDTVHEEGGKDKVAETPPLADLVIEAVADQKNEEVKEAKKELVEQSQHKSPQQPASEPTTHSTEAKSGKHDGKKKEPKASLPPTRRPVGLEPVAKHAASSQPSKARSSTDAKPKSNPPPRAKPQTEPKKAPTRAAPPPPSFSKSDFPGLGGGSAPSMAATRGAWGAWGAQKQAAAAPATGKSADQDTKSSAPIAPPSMAWGSSPAMPDSTTSSGKGKKKWKKLALNADAPAFVPGRR